MHSQVFDFQGGDRNFDIKFPAGEALHLAFENAPEHGVRVLTIGETTNAPPLIEVTAEDELLLSSENLELVPEGRLCLFNIWQRDGEVLDLVAEGRFVRRASLEPVGRSAPMQAGAEGPLLLVLGDSVMQNVPGTRPILEQMIGHRFRFPKGYQGAVGGNSAQDIWFAVPEMVARIQPGKTVVLVGPVGANQTAADDSFEEITGYLSQIYGTLLDAGAWVVAVPTLPDGMGVMAQDAEKSALANWVRLYEVGGQLSYAGADISVAAHDRFVAVDVTAFDRDSMKSDVSHPNATGARFLAGVISEALLELVAGDAFAEGIENLLGTAAGFSGERPAVATGVTGNIPTQWDVLRSQGSAGWSGAFDGTGVFTLSVDEAPDDGTCVLTLPNVQIGAVSGDVLNFLVDLEIEAGAAGLKSVGLVGVGSTTMTMDADWAVAPGRYALRTRDAALLAAQTTESFQILVHVEAGASLTVRFHRASAFFAGNTAGDLSISGTPTAEAQVGESYAFAPGVDGGQPPYVFDLAGGALPAGLTLDPASGAISGVPTAAEVQAGIALRVRDQLGAAAVLPHFEIEVTSALVTDVVGWDSAINTSAPLQLAYGDQGQRVQATADINGLRHTRGADALVGKCYFECELGANVLGVGVATSELTALSGGGFGTGRSFWSGGTLFYTGGMTAMGGSLALDDVVQIAVDVEARLFWVRRNGEGDWNNTPGADPGTGTGGCDISGLNGDLFPYGGLNNAAGAHIDLHGTIESQTYTAPIGFGAIG